MGDDPVQCSDSSFNFLKLFHKKKWENEKQILSLPDYR